MSRISKARLCMVALLLVPAFAEARDQGPAEEAQEGPILLVRGDTGAEPQLTDAKGARWLLGGPAKDELLRLDGHTVRVFGASSPQRLSMRTLEVTRYDILESGGGKPFVGVLRQEDRDRMRLERPEGSVFLRMGRGLMRRLAPRLGCKVWAAGPLSGDTVRVGRAGWLSCPPPEKAPAAPGTDKNNDKSKSEVKDKDKDKLNRNSTKERNP